MAETGAQMLARIKPKLDEDFTEICLRPDLAGVLEELNEELKDAQLNPKSTEKRRADGTTARSRKLAQDILDIQAQMDETAVEFRFRALPRDKFRALCDDNPPRRGNQYDAAVGYDSEAVEDELVRRSLIEPVFDDESWAQLLDVISIGEWNQLRKYANKVNGSVVTESPKSALASRILSSRASSSRQPSEQE